MILIAIWVLESAIGWALAARVLADSRATLKYLERERPEPAQSYKIDPARDWLVLVLQSINVVIGLASALGISHAGFRAPISIATIIGLMLSPILLGWISLKTYRHRHPGP